VGGKLLIMTKARDLADIVSNGSKETQLHGIGINY
jgi:hypothetical protein